MNLTSTLRLPFFSYHCLMACLLAIFVVPDLPAADYILTIAGGYNPSGNQASLEANVIFFQQVLREQHRGSKVHEIFFADGHDSAPDLQVLPEKPSALKLPATELIAALHRRRGMEEVEYRNHRVPQISGALDPQLVKGSLESFARRAQKGDRLIIYVTAHGSPGPDDQEYNTTIDCWNEEKITAIEFEKWMTALPADVPIVMVMAQCYCGGFARTIFPRLDKANGLSPQLRVGFFAQQHNLPAAGCRPDIEHDEEFSSYFWGALTGRSRNGVPIPGCDINRDGVISFAEAYAHAVIAGETIDIPLRTTDVFLRTYSRIPDAETASTSGTALDNLNVAKSGASQKGLLPLTGSIQSFIDRGRPVQSRIVTSLSEALGFSLHDDVSKVLTAYDEHRDHPPQPPARGRGRRGSGSARRDFLQQVRENWPELADERHWEESPLLKPENQEALAAELKQLPGWKAFDERRKQLEATGDQSAKHELRDVKFRRLIKALELVILEKNLSLVATRDLQERYQRMIALEESGFVDP